MEKHQKSDASFLTGILVGVIGAELVTLAGLVYVVNAAPKEMADLVDALVN